MRILGIETSCDETAIALVNKQGDRFVVEKSILSSQADIHALYGGVVPEVAAREHSSTIFPLLKKLDIPANGEGIDAIAVTSGPGLVPALRVGVEFAKALSWLWNKPLVGVNHLEGHIYSVWLNEKAPSFPAICLLVSGGHTELVLAKGEGDYEILGRTRDDAAGEAFDKVAKLLGLPYPGGPHISKSAKAGNPSAINFPRPMLESGDLDFSFSGLKTAVRLHVEKNEDSVEDVAASFQQAVVDTLVTKTLVALHRTGAKSVILSGGVSANTLLRETLQEAVEYVNEEVTFHAPDLSLTGDNAVMIAMAGAVRAEKKEFVDPLTLVPDPNMKLN